MANFLERWVKEDRAHELLVAEEELILDVTEKIWTLLEDRGVSKAELAASLETSKAHVSQLLSGSRNMTLRTLASIAYSLSVKPKFEFEEVLEEHEWIAIGPVRAGYRELVAENELLANVPGEELTWTKPVVGYKMPKVA